MLVLPERLCPKIAHKTRILRRVAICNKTAQILLNQTTLHSVNSTFLTALSLQQCSPFNHPETNPRTPKYRYSVIQQQILLQVTKTLLVMILAFNVCWLPYAVGSNGWAMFTSWWPLWAYSYNRHQPEYNRWSKIYVGTTIQNIMIRWQIKISMHPHFCWCIWINKYMYFYLQVSCLIVILSSYRPHPIAAVWMEMFKNINRWDPGIPGNESILEHWKANLEDTGSTKCSLHFLSICRQEKTSKKKEFMYKGKVTLCCCTYINNIFKITSAKTTTRWIHQSFAQFTMGSSQNKLRDYASLCLVILYNFTYPFPRLPVYSLPNLLFVGTLSSTSCSTHR